MTFHICMSSNPTQPIDFAVEHDSKEQISLAPLYYW